MTKRRYSEMLSLRGQRVAVTGPTGGLGRVLCDEILQCGAELWLLDRSETRSAELQGWLRQRHPEAKMKRMPLDLEDPAAVVRVFRQLEQTPPDVLILNAGIYCVPRHTCKTGLDNVFQVNFASHYCLTRALLPALEEQHARVVAVGSIAYRYAKTDPQDVDFAKRRAASLVYGNSKRYLMAALWSLFETESKASLSVVHPGITFTNITAHYPPWLFALIKGPMKVIFMSPRRAVRSLLCGVLEPCGNREWIGPRLFSVWGAPVKQRVSSIAPAEQQRIADTAERIYQIWRVAYIEAPSSEETSHFNRKT